MKFHEALKMASEGHVMTDGMDFIAVVSISATDRGKKTDRLVCSNYMRRGFRKSYEVKTYEILEDRWIDCTHLELEECPGCGSSNIDCQLDNGTTQVVCSDCETSGPKEQLSETSVEDAISKWNDLPRDRS